MKRVYLLTGKPGTGKTTIIKQAVDSMSGKACGFYTEEIRVQGVRQGFRLITLDGQTAVLAHVGIKSPYRVSKYGVDVKKFEEVGVAALARASRECPLVVIDEIGKMELFSEKFKETVLQIIDGDKMVLGTVMLSPHPWADAIKRRPQVNLLTVTRENNSKVLDEVLSWLKAMES